MEKKKSSITINWRGKEDRRGLTETALETMRYVGSEHKKPIWIEEADKLEAEYMKFYEKTKDNVGEIRKLNLLSFDKELEMVRRYVKVRL